MGPGVDGEVAGVEVEPPERGAAPASRLVPAAALPECEDTLLLGPAGALEPNAVRMQVGKIGCSSLRLV